MASPFPLEDSAEDMLRSCHAKMRQFSAALNRIMAAWEENPADPQLPSAARAVARYFREALPLHARDEDESITPRLLAVHPELAPVLAELEAGHVAMPGMLGPICAGLDRMAAGEDPADPTLTDRAHDLTTRLEAHARTEESTWFARFAALPEAERRAVRLEMAARRAG